MMRSYDVYKITNKVNNKVYIGITSKGLSARWKEHLYNALSNYTMLYANTVKKTSQSN